MVYQTFHETIACPLLIDHILITGRNGFIGQAVAIRLKRDHTLVSVVRDTKNGIDYSDEKIVKADLRTVSAEDVQKYPIDLIIHLAANVRGNKKALLENNVKIGQNIFKIAQARNVPVIYLSSTNVLFSDQLGAYAQSKKICEDLLSDSCHKYLIIRVPLVIGPDSPQVQAIKKIYRKFHFFPLLGGAAGRVQPVSLSCLGDLISSKVKDNFFDNTILNVVGSCEYTYRDIIKKVLNTFGRLRVVRIPFWISKIVIKFFERIHVSFFISSEELRSINMDKIVTAIHSGKIQYLDNSRI